MVIALKLLGVVYLGIGFLNSIYVWATVSRNDCIAASGILDAYCNTGMGISHALAVALWPLFWM